MFLLHANESNMIYRSITLFDIFRKFRLDKSRYSMAYIFDCHLLAIDENKFLLTIASKLVTKITLISGMRKTY